MFKLNSFTFILAISDPHTLKIVKIGLNIAGTFKGFKMCYIRIKNAIKVLLPLKSFNLNICLLVFLLILGLQIKESCENITFFIASYVIVIG